MKIPGFLFAFFFIVDVYSQNFSRTELTTPLSFPFELQIDINDYLYISESRGRVSKVNTVNGLKKVIFTASDYFDGSDKEKGKFCHNPKIIAGTFGLALHPLFNFGIPKIYFMYSYNAGNIDTPFTQHKIVELNFDFNTDTVSSVKTIITDLPTGFDHFGGRLICARLQTHDYLFVSIGDNGISEDAQPDCYQPQGTNPNNFTQDIRYKNGKILRYNLDGTIPEDNPIKENAIFTRGHRNPQGLISIKDKNLILCIEHGDRTDDEMNLLIAGGNYGWKNVRGFHTDSNYIGEMQFIQNYKNDTNIKNDKLIEPIFTWCSNHTPLSKNNAEWCTVAPSDGMFYDKRAIPFLENSILVTTLKKGNNMSPCVWVLATKFEDGRIKVNQKIKLFENDYLLNGRLRDIAISNNGKRIFLINNGGPNNLQDKIIIYDVINKVTVFPNPSKDKLHIFSPEPLTEVEIFNGNGKKIYSGNESTLDIKPIPKGIYIIKVKLMTNQIFYEKIIIQ